MSNRTICGEDTPDPWMIAANGVFYLTSTLGNRVEIWSSLAMEDFHNCRKSVVWHPAPQSPWSADIWAPELHYLDSSWYIYVSGAQPGQGNPSHRTIVLRSHSQDPMDVSAWAFLGPLKGMPDHWAIDATVFSPSPNELYCCYSGWPLGDHSDTQQDLFVVRMASPEAAIQESLVCVSRAQLPWERCDGGRRGINEGPTWVDMSPAFRGIVYSASGSWTNEYKLGLLQLSGNDPLLESSWKKREAPLLVSNHQAPFGPGHASFIQSPYGHGQLYCIYHGTERADEGWNNRKARVVCMGPEQFALQAPTLCCATMGPGAVQGGQRGQPGFPGGAQFQPRQAERQSGQHHGFFDKLKDKLREF